MDHNDTTTLISELLQKLAELQQKVDQYSQGLAHQFQLYEHDKLKDVPEDVSSKVEKAIANSLHHYPAMQTGLERQLQLQHPSPSPSPSKQQRQHQHQRHSSADSYLSLTTDSPPPPPPPPSPPSTSTSASTTHTHGNTPTNNLNRMSRPGNRGSPPPVVPDASDSPDNGPSSPRERETELHGLFIPSYLPLLEGTDRTSPGPTSLPTVPENSDRDNSKSDHKSPLSLPPIVVARPNPVRRHTEETLSSVNSDDSTTKVKRSALRRSSSSSTKTFSPRRVRFDVEGQEVLPTASPQARPSEPPSFSLGNVTSIPSVPYQSGINEDDDLGLLGSSPPRPKKITSTDKLKALARSSTEDTSNWTVVGNQSNDDDEDDELVMAGLNGRRRGSGSQAAVVTQNSSSAAHTINGAQSPNRFAASSKVVQDERDVDMDEDEEDDDLLSMPPLASFKGKKRFSPDSSPAPEKASPQSRKSDKKGAQAKNMGTTSSNVHKPDDDFEMDPLFEFEEAPIRSNKYIEEEDEPEDLNPEPSEGAKETHSNSISMPIAMTPPTVAAPARSRAQSTSIGSFRGKQIQMPSIRNEAVYKKAMEMGDFQSFIGSVDGRTGIDESTSYQPEAMKFSGTPKSLSERLVKEELEELRRRHHHSASYSG